MGVHPLLPTRGNVLADSQDKLLLGHEPNILVSPTQDWASSGGADYLKNNSLGPCFCYEKYASLLAVSIVNDEVKVELCLAAQEVDQFELQDNVSSLLPIDHPVKNRIYFIQDEHGYFFLKVPGAQYIYMYSPAGVLIDKYELSVPEELNGAGIVVSSPNPVHAHEGFLSISGLFEWYFTAYSYGYRVSYTQSGFVNNSRAHFASVMGNMYIMIYSPEQDQMSALEYPLFLTWLTYNQQNSGPVGIKLPYCAAESGNRSYRTRGYGFGFANIGVEVLDGTSRFFTSAVQRPSDTDPYAWIGGIIEFDNETFLIIVEGYGGSPARYHDTRFSLGVGEYVPLRLSCLDTNYAIVWQHTLPARGPWAQKQFEFITTDRNGSIYVWYRDKVEKRDLLTFSLQKEIEYPPYLLGYCLQSARSSFTGSGLVNPEKFVFSDCRAVQAWSSINRVRTDIPYLHVHSITSEIQPHETKPGWYRVIFRVTMRFENGSPGANSTVEAFFVGTGPPGRVAAQTDVNGTALFVTDYIRGGHNCCTYIKVMSAYQNGVSKYNYREAENLITEFAQYV